MERNSLNEALKRRASEAQERKTDDETSLDDSRRVKVLSPSRLVFKRFIRNRLAVIGVCILVAIFAFAFLGPLFYEHGETEVFKHYNYMYRTYATATFNTEFTQTAVPDAEELPSAIRRVTNSRILKMNENGQTYSAYAYSEGESISHYLLTMIDEHVYTWSILDGENVGYFKPIDVICEDIDSVLAEKSPNEITDTNGDPITAGLLALANSTFKTLKGSTKEATFDFEGLSYKVSKNGKISYKLECLTPVLVTNEGIEIDADTIANAIISENYAWEDASGMVYVLKSNNLDAFDIEVIAEEKQPISVFSDFSFNASTTDFKLSQNLKVAALLNINSNKAFTIDGIEYKVDSVNATLLDASGAVVATIANTSIVDGNAQDTFDIEFKEALIALISDMKADNRKEDTMVWSLLQKEITKDKDNKEILIDKLDEDGNPIFKEETLRIYELEGTYTIERNIPFWVNDKYAPMSAEHPFGTDGNGMDILARMMYGGQISLMVGFVVVIISMFIGVILGGIAGYFGGWVDTFVMRLVEIFYCIPSYPILIILGGYMDAMKMDAEVRLYVMMAVLGLLGWAGIARLVRGQILSLREQEFMVATESTGVKVRHRIFRHLVPNVMPQLIVSATGSLGGVILTESSLSFLGLGVKFPLATWGNMIEFVTGLNENLGRYIYIWLPVGILICLTVISFNFVGDGLRDAFDPKMKR